MKFLVFIVVGLFANSIFLQCSGNQTSAAGSFPNVAVFEYSAKDNQYVFKLGKSVSLTKSDISETLEILQKTIDKHNPKATDYKKLAKLDSYNLQFVPILNEKNEKEIWVNALCQSFSKDEKWRENLIMVDDGGSCFFNVYINLSQKTSQRISVNGEA